MVEKRCYFEWERPIYASAPVSGVPVRYYKVISEIEHGRQQIENARKILSYIEIFEKLGLRIDISVIVSDHVKWYTSDYSAWIDIGKDLCSSKDIRAVKQGIQKIIDAWQKRIEKLKEFLERAKDYLKVEVIVEEEDEEEEEDEDY